MIFTADGRQKRVQSSRKLKEYYSQARNEKPRNETTERMRENTSGEIQMSDGIILGSSSESQSFSNF